jgi:hypothetical protein
VDVLSAHVRPAEKRMAPIASQGQSELSGRGGDRQLGLDQAAFGCVHPCNGLTLARSIPGEYGPSHEGRAQMRRARSNLQS